VHYDTVHNALRKAQAVLEAACPLDLSERDPERISWLIHVAQDYVEEALEGLDADDAPGQKDCGASGA
jgi:hypothetical protein